MKDEKRKGGYFEDSNEYSGEVYYDENGGYYDEAGNYFDSEGGVYDVEGGYTDAQGNYYTPEEMAAYANGEYYGEEGNTEEAYEELTYEDIDTGLDKYNTGRSVKREYNSGVGRPTNYQTGKKKTKIKAGIVIARVVLVIVTVLIITVGGLYLTLREIYNGPESARELMVSTIQETGQLKFINKMFLTVDEIEEITGRNSMGTLDAEVDTGLISFGGETTEEGDNGEAAEAFDINGFEIVEISGRTYHAKMMIINDPSRVKLTTIYDNGWKEYGETLDVLVDNGGFLAGVNGGEYQSDSNKGGSPKGLVVCDGQIQYNNPMAGDVMVGFNTDNYLIIKDIGGMSADNVKNLVAELNIRDAVTFKDIADGDDNHFTKLMINGESVSLNGSGSGANPRTVIGQKADGTVLLLVTDGRGEGGHLGATAADVISIMQEYGAVNAANLDGGSSSCMYCDGEWEMTSVTLYYKNASWRLPLAFVVERR
jgi:exopolysaccharide biosynthesis protein